MHASALKEDNTLILNAINKARNLCDFQGFPFQKNLQAILRGQKHGEFSYSKR